MYTVIRIIILLLVSYIPVSAQSTATPGSLLTWDQPAPDSMTASAYTYRVFLNGSTNGLPPVTGISCFASGPGQSVCNIPFPAVTPGDHTLRMTASNSAGASMLSEVFAFTMVAIPLSPANIRIQAGPPLGGN